jgi:GPH family glycoside/pentoside/hexuronide:cation symporter
VSTIAATAEKNAAPAAAERAHKLGVAFKSAYGVGQFIESVATALLNAFFFFYITNVCGLSGSLTGIAMFLALALDAIADPLIGSFSDNLATRWGRRVPVMVTSLAPVTLAVALLFSIPASRSGTSLFAYVLGLLVAVRVAGSGFVIPYMGLGAELSDDYDERSSIVGFRSIFGMIATLAAYVLGFGVFLGGPKGLLDRAAYVPLGWVSAAIMLLAGALSCYASLRARPRVAAVPVKRQLWRRLFGEVREVFRNPSFRALFTGVLLFFVGQGVALTLALDGNKYFWGLDVSGIQLVAVGSVAGLALGLPVAFLFIGRVEKRTVVVGGIIAICLAEFLPVAARVLGFMPTSGPVALAVVVGASGVVGVAVTMVSISFQSALADAVDEHEHLFGARREGLYFSSLTFAAKAAIGLGSLISGLLLDAIHFPSQQIAAGSTAPIAADVLRHLGYGFGPGAAAITAISVIFLARYRLDRRSHAAIRAALGR